MRVPTPAENRLTQFDLQLIAALQHDARRPNTEIARELGVAESTVRRRIDWLIREGSLEHPAAREADVCVRRPGAGERGPNGGGPEATPEEGAMTGRMTRRRFIE